MKTVPHEALEEIVRRLVIEFQPEQIILFGSHAWGAPTQDSDLDLLVIVSESKEAPHERAVRAHHCLWGVLVPMDLLVRTRAEVDRYRHVRPKPPFLTFWDNRTMIDLNWIIGRVGRAAACPYTTNYNGETSQDELLAKRLIELKNHMFNQRQENV